MSEMVVVVVLLVVAALMGAAVASLGGTVSAQSNIDPKIVEDYKELQAAGIPMSLDTFAAIREKNRREIEEFGDGKHAPHWPRQRRNGHGTLHRGVWIDDSEQRPSDRVLDEFRKNYWKRHKVVRFTLVEGEQDAPWGKNGAIQRVMATAGTPSTVTDRDGNVVSEWPSVSVSVVGEEFGGSSGYSPASLPMEMSTVVEINEP